MPEDAEVGALIQRMFRRMQDLFAAAVIRAQAAGEISRELDERAIARMLLCTIQGLRVLGKTGPSEQDMAEVVDTAHARVVVIFSAKFGTDHSIIGTRR